MMASSFRHRHFRSARCALALLLGISLVLCSCSQPASITDDSSVESSSQTNSATAEDPAVQQAAQECVTAFDSSHGAYEERSIDQRDARVDVSSAQSVTVLIYLCASTLESEYGSATSDIMEMCAADIDSGANVIIETGGTSSWDNDVIDASTNQIWRVSGNGLELLADIGSQDMSDPDTLQSFITYGTTVAPADRTELVLWDHGAGAAGGFGVDENYPHDTLMTVAQIGQALAGAGVVFDFIGFDCCLMANIETATALEPYADYLLASEADEPTMGWDYQTLLSALDANPSIPTWVLAQNVCQDFATQSQQLSPRLASALSLVDLTELPAVLRAWSRVSDEACLKLQQDPAALQTARHGAGFETMSSHPYGMMDVRLFADALCSQESASALDDALADCVSVVRNSSAGKNLCGLGVYLPGTSALSDDSVQVTDMPQLYSQLGFCRSWAAFEDAWSTRLAA